MLHHSSSFAPFQLIRFLLCRNAASRMNMYLPGRFEHDVTPYQVKCLIWVGWYTHVLHSTVGTRKPRFAETCSIHKDTISQLLWLILLKYHNPMQQFGRMWCRSSSTKLCMCRCLAAISVVGRGLCGVFGSLSSRHGRLHLYC
jgi:hypothetical protein